MPATNSRHKLGYCCYCCYCCSAASASAASAAAFVDPAFTIAVVAPATLSATTLLLPRRCFCLCHCSFCHFQAAGKWHSFCCVTFMAARICNSFCITVHVSASGVHDTTAHGTTCNQRADLLSLPWRDFRKYEQPLACLAVLWRPQLWHESWDTRYFCLVSLMCTLGSVPCQHFGDTV